MEIIEVIILTVMMLALIIGIGEIGIYWIYNMRLENIRFKRQPLKTIDIVLLSKYKEQREIDDEDKEKVLGRYASTSLINIGLSENGKMTAWLSESGRRLLKK